jgi:(2Fe-2S) ferredoxin
MFVWPSGWYSDPFPQIYTPRGAGVWYGRVTPHEVESIVMHTIINGQVLPTILRGGMDLAGRGKMTLYDW